MANIQAPEGKIWVCTACGKTSDNLYGNGENVMPMWDVSCTLHAVLADKDKVTRGSDGRVTQVDGEVKTVQEICEEEGVP